MKELFVSFMLLLGAMTVQAEPAGRDKIEASDKVQSFIYRVVNAYPHDSKAFTQGLVIEDGVMYEGTGLYGGSSVRRVDLATGKVFQQYMLPPQFFGEGITVFGDKIIQLTWKSGVAFVYDKDGFELLRLFICPVEGWGITHDGQYLIISDGTATLYFIDPETFKVKRRVRVVDGKGGVTNLNELEYVEGKVFANIWQSDRIAIIDPATGRVDGWIDLSGLPGKEGESEQIDVLNGIAYDKQTRSLFVTGKLWPRLFQIELVNNSEE